MPVQSKKKIYKSLEGLSVKVQIKCPYHFHFQRQYFTEQAIANTTGA